MIEWCTADWNTLADVLSVIEWKTHKNAWNATSIITVATSIVSVFVATATFCIALRQTAFLQHDSRMRAYEKYDSLYQKVRDGLLNFGTTGKVQDALECFRNAREVAILYQYPAVIRNYCLELEAAATNAIEQESITNNPAALLYEKDKVTKASNILSELRAKYTVSQALDFFSKHTLKL